MKYLVTGGAGFIGSNFVDRVLSRGEMVVVLDDLSRPKVETNLVWLRERHGSQAFEFIRGAIEDRRVVDKALPGVDVVVHLAGQTAVTKSVIDPRRDFEANALGTLNVLEAARHADNPPIVIYASTNKVYGPLTQIPVVEQRTRYAYAENPFGVAEDEPLDFHSPYGCSKGAGDQYVRDYARIYGLRTVVFRQSCIYGPRQMGIEDQGWIAWFLIRACQRQPIRICGDGKQVRDILFVGDLLDVYDAAIARIDTAAGQVYNVGGGSRQSISVWSELEVMLKGLLDMPQPTFGPWRLGDQRVYISDIRKAQRELHWQPVVSVQDGITLLARWIESEIGLFSSAG